MLTLSGI